MWNRNFHNRDYYRPAAAAITVNMLKAVFEPYGTAAGIKEPMANVSCGR
jgi:S-adenosylmethionine hydrolase